MVLSDVAYNLLLIGSPSETFHYINVCMNIKFKLYALIVSLIISSSRKILESNTSLVIKISLCYFRFDRSRV